MSKSKILVSIVILLCMMFAVFEFIGYGWLSEVSRSLIVPSITLLFLIKYKPKLCCFALFLILFSISELISVISLTSFVENNIQYETIYYFVNGLYIISYGFLVVEIVKGLNFRQVVKNFTLHLLILLAVNVYLLYVLLNIVAPYLVSTGEYTIEILYNAFILLVLSTSLINFLYKGTKKALLMFLGSLCIVFSEVIQVAYLYISEKELLNISYTTLLVAAFCIFYIQATLSNEEVPILVRNETF